MGAIFLLAGPEAAQAQTGREIMEQVYDREVGDNIVHDLSMTLTSAGNDQIRRDFRVYRKRFGKDVYAISWVLAPPEQKNIGLLLRDYTAPGKKDEQWLYLPGKKKAERIPPGEAGGSVLESDFSFFDLSRPDMADFNYRLMKEPQLNGVWTWQIQVLPKSREIAEHSGYSKSVFWVGKANQIIIRAIHWAYNNRRLKSMQVERIEEVEGILLPTRVRMTTREGLVTVQTTEIELSNILINQNLRKRRFSVRSLQRGLK